MLILPAADCRCVEVGDYLFKLVNFLDRLANFKLFFRSKRRIPCR